MENESDNILEEQKKGEMLLSLKANAVEYYGINQQLKPFLIRKEFLKAENMMMMKLLGIERADFDPYRIEMIYPEDKIGVDEEMLRELIGNEIVENLKEVPVEKLAKGIERGTIPLRATEAIIKRDGNPYLKVFKIVSVIKKL
jgi:hypothetical protein